MIRTVGRSACAAVVVAVLLVACGEDDGEKPAAPPSESTASSPFSIGSVPDRFGLVLAGRGTDEQEWDLDCCGSLEPYTVLAPGGDLTRTDDLVFVSITGYAGYQGGIDEAVGYEDADELEVDGREARYVAPGPGRRGGTRWSELIVVESDDVAVRVTSPSASLETLRAIHRQVELEPGHAHAPRVPDPPGRLEAVGHADADALLAVRAWMTTEPDRRPGPPAAFTAGWIAPDGSQLTVQTVPGRSGHLDALALEDAWHDGGPSWQIRDRHDGPEPWLLVERAGDGHPGNNAVWGSTSSGDLLVVASSGPSVATDAELMATFHSVTPTDDAGWTQLVELAYGGPELVPDPGRTELGRGAQGGVHWLMQDTDQRGMPELASAPHGSGRIADPCLRLAGRSPLCASIETVRGNAAGGLEYIAKFNAAEGDPLPDFMVVFTTLEATTFSATLESNANSGHVRPLAVPGSSPPSYAVVLFVEDPGMPICPVNAAALPPPLRPLGLYAHDLHTNTTHCYGNGWEPFPGVPVSG